MLRTAIVAFSVMIGATMHVVLAQICSGTHLNRASSASTAALVSTSVCTAQDVVAVDALDRQHVDVRNVARPELGKFGVELVTAGDQRTFEAELSRSWRSAPWSCRPSSRQTRRCTIRPPSFARLTQKEHDAARAGEPSSADRSRGCGMTGPSERAAAAEQVVAHRNRDEPPPEPFWATDFLPVRAMSARFFTT